jgi:TonB family protein
VEELKQILVFRLSPVGQKLAASQPEILTETAQASLRYAQQIVPDINREIVADHPDWKKQLEETNSPPSLISKVDPQVPKGESPKSGTVVVSIVIDANGVPQDTQVVGSLGSGFDQKAIEAVQKWRFKPAMRNGVAVKTKATVEVNFRVMSKQ